MFDIRHCSKTDIVKSDKYMLTLPSIIRSTHLLELTILISVAANAQQSSPSTSDTTCVQKDITDVLRAAVGKPPKTNVKIGSLLLIPIIRSNPATGFMYGIGGQYALKLGDAETRYSLLSGSAQFTTKHQQIFVLKNNIYTKNNNIFFYGGLALPGLLKLRFKNNANFFSLEWRNFHPLSSRNPRHLLAFWVLGNFAPEGEFPYLILPATAYDQRSRSARGYTQGRFSGNNMLYGEAEYRFPISQCSGLLGGVLFVNATTATNPKQSVELFDYTKPGYGIGQTLRRQEIPMARVFRIGRSMTFKKKRFSMLTWMENLSPNPIHGERDSM